MVDEKLINTIFEDVINKHYLWKCGKGGFNHQVLQTFNNFREETKNYTKEKCIFVTNKGEIVWSKDGSIDTVELDTYQGWLQSEHNGLLHIEHNHPQIKGLEYFPSVLSRADVDKMIDSANGRYLYRSITAEYPNGSRMSVSKTRDFDKEHDFNKDERIRSLSKFYNDKVTEYVLKYRDKILEYTGMSQDEFVRGVGSDNGWGSEEYKVNVCKNVVDDIGGLQSYLESEGVVEEFLKEGLVLKVSGENKVYG